MRYDQNLDRNQLSQGPASGVTLRRVKMPKQNRHSLKVFVRDAQGKRILCGLYETEVENYVLNVDVAECPLEVRSIEIEFIGKVQA